MLALGHTPFSFATTMSAVSPEPHHHEHDQHDDGDNDHDTGEQHEHGEEMENIVVQASRSGRIANDQPLRVELISEEEIQEKAAMRPGNISMLVAETGGVRMQTTSPALGSANVRLQGLYGRYTQLLADGLPLYGNQAASIGLLQVPPTDLGRVEIIKGSASSLYGGSALGGVINLVSRRPHGDNKGEVLFNATTRDGQDLTAYGETQLNAQTSGSITLGAHHQHETDIDGDTWLDLAGYERYSVRPRVFWQGDEGQTLYLTSGWMTENRRGGNSTTGTVASGERFVQSLESQRVDTGLVFTMPLEESMTFHTRGSAMVQDHQHYFADVLQDDSHESYLLEASVSGYSEYSDWVFGLAYQADHYTADTHPLFDYRYEVPAAFASVDYQLNEQITASLSGRVDQHSEFGTQFSPRLSVLYRLGDLAVRSSYGQGYYAPTPFVEEIEAAGLSRLAVFDQLQEETAETASIDFTYAFDNVETSLTLFGSNVGNATRLAPFSSVHNQQFDRVLLINAEGESQIRGSEVLLRYRWQDLKLTASYLYLDASELDPESVGTNARREIALTPEHSAGFVAMWERHGEFRLGFESYYTGTQRVNDNPYVDYTSPYWHLGLMGEITVGRVSYFINFENLLDVRQTDEHPMLLPARSASGLWTTDIWSRTDGFITNAGIRVRFD